MLDENLPVVVNKETGEELPAVPEQPIPTLTSAQSRINAVSTAMDAAMSKASTLMLTPEEIKELAEDFPDEAFKTGAAGKEHLIYIEHAFLRDRFNSIIGMGQWAILRTRPHWGEDFTTEQGKKATRIYADCALLVRGCMVAEAIGDMVYYPNNPSQNFGDAAEGAVTAAFRRCAKNFGVGLQAWKKDFCEGWHERKKGGHKPQPKTEPKADSQATKPPSVGQWRDKIKAVTDYVKFRAAEGIYNDRMGEYSEADQGIIRAALDDKLRELDARPIPAEPQGDPTVGLDEATRPAQSPLLATVLKDIAGKNTVTRLKELKNECAARDKPNLTPEEWETADAAFGARMRELTKPTTN
jgi:hypothetical protein